MFSLLDATLTLHSFIALSVVLPVRHAYASVREAAPSTGLHQAATTIFRWRGGAESIWQNALFKDYFELAEEENAEERKTRLFVLGREHPLRFIQSRRKIASVLSQHPRLLADFKGRYPGVVTMGEYYDLKSAAVKICDLIPLLRISPETPSA